MAYCYTTSATTFKELKTNVMNNDDNNIVDAVTAAATTTTTSLADISGLLLTTSASIENLWRPGWNNILRLSRYIDVEIMKMLRQGGRQRGIYGNHVSSAIVNATAATTASSASATNSAVTNIYSSSSTTFSIMPTWMMEGVWQLKMRALTQRIYIDDLETNDAEDAVNEEVEFERIATTARPGTSIKPHLCQDPVQAILEALQHPVYICVKLQKQLKVLNRELQPRAYRAQPQPCGLSRPGSSIGSRPASRCGTASRVRATSAAAFNLGDSTAPLYQASRLNPTIYAERKVLVKALFQFLYYHEADVLKAYSLCEAVMEVHKQNVPHQPPCVRWPIAMNGGGNNKWDAAS
ncbi:Tetratricopeptide repeat protein 8 [Eumeta japonica]|uniref:Tetratricopeptide repeat protein 8 n=1 Tax=Eumeta variegata TaxID=151549 RepID=A0A4C1T6J8_EUMVA|nr:Tetratricopeptide repeat protein 8 [Eumeta japonica]